MKKAMLCILYIPTFCYHLGGLSDCPISKWTGDGICDDLNNIFVCNYDGGDCCGFNVNTQYCSDCLCLSSNQTANSTGNH